MATEPAPEERPPRRGLWSPAVLDRIDQVVIVVLWLWLLRRVYLSPNPWSPLLLVSETAVVVLTLLRRPSTALSTDPRDWLLALVATCTPLLVVPGQPLVPALVPLGAFCVVVGNGLQIWAKLVLRRSFGIAPANRGIKLTGPYRFVRHPMYAGYAVVHLGILLLLFAPLNLLIYASSWTAQIYRLMAEERLLARDETYRGYLLRVRWRLVPGLF